MTKRRSRWIAAVFSVVLALCGPSSVVGSPGEAPVWREGQSWSYRGHYAGPGPVEDFETTLTVVAMESSLALLRTQDSWDFGNVTTDTTFSLPDFAVVASNITHPMGQQYHTEYSPPLALFSFPLIAGKSWESPTSSGTYAYRVLAQTEVTTPVGVFDAFPIEQLNSPGIPFMPEWTIGIGFGRALMYYAGDVGQLVKYEAFDSQGTPFGVVEITSPPGRPLGTPFYLPVGLASIFLIGAVAIGMIIRRWRRKAPKR